MRTPLKQRGFSLVELIIAIGILGVVSTIGAVMFIRMSDLWGGMLHRVDLDITADNAFDTIGRDVRGLLPLGLADKPFTGIRGDSESEGGPSFACDQFSFPVRMWVRQPSEPPLETVGLATYALDRESHSLIRTLTPVSASDSEGQRTLIAAGVSSFRVEYDPGPGGAGWLPEWKESRLPRAIRVSIVLMNPDPPNEQIARKAVFPVEAE